MKLYYTKASPYAACVLAVISQHQASEKIELAECHPFENDKDFLASNPLGKVPCLIDNGETILDSEVICDYLDANLSGGLLFEPVYADWRLKTLYSMCSGLIDASVCLRIEATREEQGCKSDFWWDRHQTAIARTLIEIENRLPLLPEELTIIHIALYCALAYLDFRHPSVEWRSTHFELSKFFDRLKGLECIASLQFS